jgi:hypothetical protein
MTTSGTASFDLNIDDLVEESYERLGMRMTSGNQLKTARRSMNLLFLDWANRGLNLWTIEQATLSIAQGDNELALPIDTVNVLTAVVRDPSASPLIDININRISRAEYLNVPDKATEARPAQFYVERTNIPKVYLYPAADKAYTLLYYRIRRIQDAGDYTNTTDINFRFLPCLVAGLSYYLSLKFAPDRIAVMKQLYEEEFARAAAEDRDTASFFIVPDVGY